MAEKKPIPEGKDQKALLKYFKENPEEVKKEIDYLDDFYPDWRLDPPPFLKGLIEMAKDLGLE